MALKDTTTEINVLETARLTRGVFTRVARRLGLTVSHVRRVAIGERRSSLVQGEIEKELAKLQRALKRSA